MHDNSFIEISSFYKIQIFINPGLSAELYYVREGQINDYALHFTVPVPANVKNIAFTWQSVAGKPVSELFMKIVSLLNMNFPFL
jgi:hypothetical protein